MSERIVPINSKTYLNNYGDWTAFDNNFLGRTEAKGLGEYIQPDSTKELLTEPDLPKITMKYSLSHVSDNLKRKVMEI